MEQALVVSNVVLWIAVVVLVAVVFALARQIGVLHERIAPTGALVMDHGPKPGDAAPIVAAAGLDGRTIHVGAPGARQTLLFFLSPTCPACRPSRTCCRRRSAWPGGSASCRTRC